MTVRRSIRFLLPLFAALIVSLAVEGQRKTVKFAAAGQERFPATEITWQKIFGSRKAEPSNVYTVMTQGSILAPTSMDIEKLFREWLDVHPKAEAVLVYSLQPITTDDPKSKMKSVWVVDGDENLNLYLVSKGACAAGTMVLEPGDETPLSKDKYEAFEKKVWQAEDTARTQKLGIWAKK